LKIDPSTSKPASNGGRAPRAASSQQAAGPAAAGGGSAQRPDQRDSIELSSDARKVIQLPQQSQDRGQLLARLRDEVDAGTYRPDPDVIAQRIADRFAP
jgi:anti-sigma28 factor (negative regulator of flagellin synthesis)